MSQPFIGEIRMFGGNFAPRGFAFCNGQLLSIAQNTALFSLLGTTYGGDGQTTFALPDLRSRVPIHQGQGPGLSPRVLGESGGVESVTLLSQHLPRHSHSPAAANRPAGPIEQPSFNNATAIASAPLYALPGTLVAMSAQSISSAGGGQSHPNLAPFLCISFVICLEGIYPSRN